MNDESSTWGSAARGAVALFVLRLIGVVALAIYSVPTPGDTRAGGPVVSDAHAGRSRKLDYLPRHLRIDARVTAPRTGLHYMSSRGRPAVPGLGRVSTITSLAVGLGAVLFVLVTVLDVVFAPFTGLGQSEPVGEAAALQDLLASIRCDCSTAESREICSVGRHGPDRIRLLGASGNRIRSARRRRPAAVMWVAIVASAVAFGVGHLPALASTFRSHDRADHPEPSC